MKLFVALCLWFALCIWLVYRFGCKPASNPMPKPRHHHHDDEHRGGV